MTTPYRVKTCEENVTLQSLRPSYTMLLQGSWSLLVQVIACFLTTLSHYFNKCWLITSDTPKNIFQQHHIRNSNIFIPHDDVIKWKHFPRYWPLVWGIHRSPVPSPHNGQWHGALMFSLICICINGWVNNRQAGDLRRYHAHYNVIVMANVFENVASKMSALLLSLPCVNLSTHIMMTSSNGNIFRVT